MNKNKQTIYEILTKDREKKKIKKIPTHLIEDY